VRDFVKTVRYVIIEGIFIAALIVVAILRPLDNMEWWVAVFLPFATMRLAITFSENEVMAWLRKPFCDTVEDSCGAGKSVVAKHDSVLGQLLACPICVGTWCALVLVAVYALAHSVGVLAIVVFGAAGASEFLYFAKEKVSWEGRLARTRDGQIESEHDCDEDMFPSVRR
jgi:hypothetical protein